MLRLDFRHTYASLIHHLFRRQRAAIGQILCQRIGRPDLWREQGPTALAIRHLGHRARSLPFDQRTVLMLAFDVWNGTGRASVTELFNLTSTDADTELLELIGELIRAIGRGELQVDHWIREHRGETLAGRIEKQRRIH